MKVSYCSIGFQKNKRAKDRVLEMSLSNVITRLAQAGYDGVEIWEPHQHDLSDGELDGIRRQLADHGMQAAMLSPYFDFTTSAETAAASIHEGLWLVERAQRLGALGIRVFAGRVGSAAMTSDQWERSVRSLQTLVDQADQPGLMWVVEPHAGTLADSAEMLARYLREVNRPSVKAIYQATNLGPDYLGAFDQLARSIAHVHANNMLGDANYPPLEGGELDYGKIVERLRRIKFIRYISVEYLGVDPHTALTREIEYLRRLLKA